MIDRFLIRRGKPCTILRNPSVTSYVSMKLATNSISDNRELFREGLILADSNLQGGEIIEVETEQFLVRSVSTDYQSGQLAFLASKVNATLIHKRYTETADEFGETNKQWITITETAYSTAQVVSARLRQQEPGLLETTKWLFLIPNTIDIQKLDRLQFLPDGEKCQVDAIDDVRLPGILRIQCSDDRR